MTLAAAHLAWRRRLAAGALGRLGRRLRALVLSLAAQALRRSLETAAHALALRRRLGLPGVGFGLRPRIELAADQLHLRHFGRIALAIADPEQARVAARPRLEARRQR